MKCTSGPSFCSDIKFGHMLENINGSPHVVYIHILGRQLVAEWLKEVVAVIVNRQL